MRPMKLAPGVVSGAALQELFGYWVDAECALPGVNVIGSHSANAALRAAKEVSRTTVIQLSHGGAQFFAGKTLGNGQHQASIIGAVAAAEYVHEVAGAYGVAVVLHTDHAAKSLLPWVEGMLDHGERHFEQHGEPLFSSHMLDLSEEPLRGGLGVSRAMLSRMNRLQVTLEIELGVTGSAAFGITHGVYKPGNVKLTPVILKNSRDHLQAQRKTSQSRCAWCFTAGRARAARRSAERSPTASQKMNIDTATEWEFTQPVKVHGSEGRVPEEPAGEPRGRRQTKRGAPRSTRVALSGREGYDRSASPGVRGPGFSGQVLLLPLQEQQV